jgi:hypothetical protein
MLNHVRTLLLNVHGIGAPGADFPGEAAVPPDYHTLRLPTHLETIRQRLFGANPDRLMLNYRLKQFMTLLHATPLVEYVTALDPRITYVTDNTRQLFLPATFTPVVSQSTGPTAELFLQGKPAAPDASGRCRHQYLVDILSSATVAVTQLTPPHKHSVFDFVLTGGLSNRLPLGDSGYGFLLSTDNVSSTWRLTIQNRPQWDLGQIAASLESIGEPVLLQLFGTSPVPPYDTFHNVWRDHPELPYRLSGILLALAYRTEEIRRG